MTSNGDATSPARVYSPPQISQVYTTAIKKVEQLTKVIKKLQESKASVKYFAFGRNILLLFIRPMSCILLWGEGSHVHEMSSYCWVEAATMVEHLTLGRSKSRIYSRNGASLKPTTNRGISEILLMLNEK